MLKRKRCQKIKKIKKKAKKLVEQNLDKFFDIQKSKKILFYQKLNYYLWNLIIFLALTVLIFISINELLWHFHLVKPIQSPAYLKAQFYGEILAISIILIELLSGFSKAANKALFIKQNWLVILAILPIGIFSKGFRAFEILGVLEELYLFRGFQIVGKITELERVGSFILAQIPFGSRFILVMERLLVFFEEISVQFFRFFRLLK